MDEFQLVIFIGLLMVLVSSLGLLPDVAKPASCFQQQIAGEEGERGEISVKKLQPKVSLASWCHQCQLVNRAMLNTEILNHLSNGPATILTLLKEFITVVLSLVLFYFLMILSLPVSFNSVVYILIWSTKERYAPLHELSTLLDKHLEGWGSGWK